MGNLLAALENLEFMDALWLFYIAFVLHEAEEWNITEFERRNFVGLPPAATHKSARTWVVFVCVVGFVWCAAVALSGSPTVAAFLLLPAVALVLQNALQHVYWSFYFRQYAPGVITSVLLVIPAGCYLVAKAVRHGHAPIWYVAIWAVLIGLGLMQTVRAGNEISPVIRAVHNTGIRLSEEIWK